MLIPIFFIFVVVAVVLGWLVGTYNGLVRAKREAENALSQIDVQLKRRYELIPNLVETVKGYMKHEQDTLEKVIQARNMAMQARTIGEKSAADAQVTQALGGFFAISEAYPELRSNENMLSLQEELKSTENKISFARQYYNDSITLFNVRIETFPGNMVAGFGGFKPKELFELDEPEARKAVKVSF